MLVIVHFNDLGEGVKAKSAYYCKVYARVNKPC